MRQWTTPNSFTYKHLINALSPILISNCLLAWAAVGTFCLLAMLSRTAILITHLQQATFPELIHYYILSLRSDLLAGSYLFTPLYLTGVMASFCGNPIYCRKLYSGFFAALIFSACFLFISSYYYFGIFGNHFDDHLFDSRGDVLPTIIAIWKDYPVLTVLFSSFLCSYLSYQLMNWLIKKLARLPASQNHWINLIILVEFSLLYINSFHCWGSQPLFWQYQFSKNPVINHSSINPGITLLDSLRKNQTDVIDQKFKKLSLEQGHEYYQRYFATSKKEQNFSFDKLFTRTPFNTFLKKHPPHVIFIQMESMGRHFLLFDNPTKNDLWGSLRPHLQHDLLFTAFLSGHNETSGSLTDLIISSPLNFSFDSRLNQVTYATSVAQVFKKAGYKTVFLTSGQLGWLNLVEALKTQGFDQVVGSDQIIQQLPRATTGWWGVHDEYTFAYALNLLKQTEHEHQPIFIYINTVTNHAFYLPPLDYQAAPTQTNHELAQRMNISQFKLTNMLKTYQYTNNALGEFINAVNKTAFGNKTIIAASGDHNQHEMKNTYANHEDELALRNSVYFYLHVPEHYKTGKVFDTEQPASHKDIFPTLYHLALSNAIYPNFGNNLALGHSKTSFGLNENMLLLAEGIITLDSIEPVFYPWQDTNHLLVGKAQALNGRQKIWLEKIKAYNGLRTWAQAWQYKITILDKPKHDHE